MTITLAEVLDRTDLIVVLLDDRDEPRRCVVCGALGAIDYCAACGSEQDAVFSPKLHKLLTEPTVFDKPLVEQVIAEPLTESVLPKPDGYRDSYFVTDRITEAVSDLITATTATDEDRRLNMAEKFDIDPTTLTDDRLDPDNWKD